MEQQTTVLHQQVLQLRAQGLSYRKIATKLSISKSYAAKLTGPGRPSQFVTGRTTLSVRQRKFAAGLMDGKTQREAALDAGVPKASADVWASRTVRDPEFQESFQILLEQAGLGERQLVEMLAQSL